MSGPGVVLAHPGTGPFVQQTARALYEADLLAEYVTTFAYRPESVAGRALRTSLRPLASDPEALLRRRQVTQVPDDALATHPLPEYLRMLAKQAGLGPVVVDRVWEATEIAFSRHVARRHIRRGGAIYAYSHAALEPFRAQHARGGICIYEMSHAHHQTVTAEIQPEYDQFPALRTAYFEHTARLDARRNARRDDELALAQHVIVNSSVSHESLLRVGVEPERITVIPLGAPPVMVSASARTGRQFIFLSAGSQSVQKGTHYLLEAWRQLAPGREAELWLVGNMQLPQELLGDLPGTVVIRPTVSQAELFELYARSGALVFPSLCEGFGMVITESMARGLPVITTRNTAGRDLIESGRNGLLVPVRDAVALAEAMEWCLSHTDEVIQMGQEAAATAAAWQWPDYRAALAAAVRGFLGEIHDTSSPSPRGGEGVRG